MTNTTLAIQPITAETLEQWMNTRTIVMELTRTPSGYGRPNGMTITRWTNHETYFAHARILEYGPGESCAPVVRLSYLGGTVFTLMQLAQAMGASALILSNVHTMDEELDWSDQDIIQIENTQKLLNWSGSLPMFNDM